VKRPPLRKLLDKRVASRLVSAFVERTPGICGCWIISDQGEPCAGSPNESPPSNAASPRYIVSPLFVNGDWCGAVGAETDGSEPLERVSSAVQFFALSLAELAAVQVEKKDIVLDALDKYREITLLYSIGETIASSLDVDQIAHLVLETNRRIIKAENGSVVLLDRDTDRFEVKASSGSQSAAAAHRAIAAVVARSGKAEIVNDTRADPRFAAHGSVRSLIGIPLKHEEKILGAIAVSNKLSAEIFTARDEKLLATLASQAAVAIDNAHLVGELKDKNRELEAALARVELLQKIASHLSKFVPQSVQRTIEQNPEAPLLDKQPKDVSILFLDIAGYTKMSESLDQEKVGYLVERYFSSFLDDIHRNEGDINETAGDGLMILFQDPDPQKHAYQAARTALAIRDKTQQINRDLRDRYEPVLVNIGINSGMASVGSTKFEGISGTRWTYTASGPVTNVAARISAFARDGAVLVSGATASRISRGFALEDLGAQQFKNVSEPIRIFRLRSAGPSSRD
jgi:class 3 adenylate cyclase